MLQDPHHLAIIGIGCALLSLSTSLLSLWARRCWRTAAGICTLVPAAFLCGCSVTITLILLSA